MSCLDVMYQVYGPPQPYFAAAYTTPYHQVRVPCSASFLPGFRRPAGKVPLAPNTAWTRRSPAPQSVRPGRRRLWDAKLAGTAALFAAFAPLASWPFR